MSKKPTVEQVKEWLDKEIYSQERRLDSAKNFGWQLKIATIEPQLLMTKAIRSFIENQPEVDKEWVRRLISLCAGVDEEVYPIRDVYDALRNIGIKIIDVSTLDCNAPFNPKHIKQYKKLEKRLKKTGAIIEVFHGGKDG